MKLPANDEGRDTFLTTKFARSDLFRRSVSYLARKELEAGYLQPWEIANLLRARAQEIEEVADAEQKHPAKAEE